MENQLPLLNRLNIYQKERFPLISHGVIISIFTFSAISYSRLSRGMTGFIDIQDFLIGVFASISLFLLVRIFDEFKDQEEDAQYRSYLPVPRGLVSLKELKIVAWIVGVCQITVIAVFQTEMLLLYAVVMLYLLFMLVEFFVPKWLKKRQLIYITSHMLIIPLIDLYSSGLDWLGSAAFHYGIIWFMAVSYVNGLVLEIGRKIRVPSTEEIGVLSYTKLFGTRKAVVVWLALLSFTTMLSIGAAWFAGFGSISIIVFVSFFLLSAIPAISFLVKPNETKSKWIEHASGIWTALMYLSLGAIPMIKNLLT